VFHNLAPDYFKCIIPNLNSTERTTRQNGKLKVVLCRTYILISFLPKNPCVNGMLNFKKKNLI